MAAGNIGFLAPGDDVKPVNVTHPYNTFTPFIEAQLKHMGAAIGVPYEMITMYFQSSYSASRAAMNMATANFKVMREQMASDFCQPIYEKFLTECVLEGYLNLPHYFENKLARRAYTRAKWNGPSALQIDPQKEIEAAIKRASVGVSTLSQETAELTGGDWRQNAAERHLEQKLFEAAPFDTRLAKANSMSDDELSQDEQNILN
jgi:capsid protein